MSEEYNGWANYETWLVRSHLSNDEGTYTYILDELVPAIVAEYPDSEASHGWRTGDHLKGLCELMADDGTPLVPSLSWWRVEWSDIGDAYVNDYRENLAYTEANG